MEIGTLGDKMSELVSILSVGIKFSRYGIVQSHDAIDFDQIGSINLSHGRQIAFRRYSESIPGFICSDLYISTYFFESVDISLCCS